MKKSILTLILWSFILGNLFCQTIITSTNGDPIYEPNSLTLFDGKLFFSASSSPFGDRALWYTDGTITEKVMGSIDGHNPERLYSSSSMLLYSYSNNGNRQIGYVNSSNSPTHNGAFLSMGNYVPRQFLEHNNKLYFFAEFSDVAYETLYRCNLDFTNREFATGPNHGDIFEDVSGVWNHHESYKAIVPNTTGDKLYFIGANGLFSYDVLNNNLNAVSTPLPPGAGSAGQMVITALGDYVILPGYSYVNGIESGLMYINTSTDLAQMVDYGFTNGFEVYDGSLFFMAEDPLGTLDPTFSIRYLNIGIDGIIQPTDFRILENNNMSVPSYILGGNILYRENGLVYLRHIGQISGMVDAYELQELDCFGYEFQGDYFQGGINQNNSGFELFRCDQNSNEFVTCLPDADYIPHSLIEFDGNLYFIAIADEVNYVSHLLKYPEEPSNGLCYSNCNNDNDPPICNGTNFTVDLDLGQSYYTFDINDFASDDCSSTLTYENASLDPSTPNGTITHFWQGQGDQFNCGTYIVTSSFPFDEAGNFNDCAFTFTVDCGGDTTSCESVVMNFSGQNEIISLTGVGMNDDFTIGCWFKADIADNGGPEDRIMEIGHVRRLELGLDQNGYLWRHDQNANTDFIKSYIDSEYLVRDGAWHHLAFVAQGTTRTLYLDFEEVDSYQASAVDYGPNFTIGNWAGPINQNAYFTGSIDDFRAYSTAFEWVDLCEEFNAAPSQIDILQLHFDFEEGMPEGDNTGISTVVNQGLLQDGVLSNFSLTGAASNFICGDYSFQDCPSECDLDITRPSLLCPSSSVDVVLVNGEYTPSMSNLNMQVFDECKVGVTFSPELFDCNHIGTQQLVALATDQAGNTNSCTININIQDTNMDCATDTCSNTVMHFDGIDDVIETDVPITGNSDYSISVDFNCGMQSNGTYPRLISFSHFETEISVHGNELAYFNGVQWINSGLIVADNSWYNVTLVREESMFYLYLDGVLISSESGPGALNFVNKMFIGGKSNGTNERYVGMIDNVKVWDSVLSEDEVCQIHQLMPSRLHYNFEDGIGGQNNTLITVVNDQSGNGYAGELRGFSLEGEQSNFVCADWGFITDCGNDDCCGSLKLIGDQTNNTVTLIKEIDGVRILLSTSGTSTEKYGAISRLDADNNVLWTGKAEEEYEFVDWELAEDGNIIVIGRTLPIAKGLTNDCVLGKIDAQSGNVMDLKKYQFFGRQSFSNIERHPYAKNSAFPYYVIGLENGSPGNSNQNDDVILLNINSNLDINWSKTYEKTDDNQWTRDLLTKDNGDIVLIGDENGGKGVLVTLDGLNGAEVNVYESNETLSFQAAILDQNGQIITVGRNNIGNTSSGMISVLDENLNLIHILDFENQSISIFVHLEKLPNDNHLTIGHMQNDHSALVEFNIINNEIVINQIHYVDNELIPSAVGSIDVIDSDLIFALTGTHTNGHNGSLDIMLGKFNLSEQISCFKDTTLSYSQIDVVMNSSSLIINNELPIPTPEDISFLAYPLSVIPVCDSTTNCSNDTIAPTCSTQNVNLALNSNGMAMLAPDMIDMGSMDDCSELTLSIDVDLFGCDDIGDNMVYLTVTDESGNVSSCSAIVVVEDKISPIVSCINDFQLNIGSNGSSIIDVNDLAVIINDECDGKVVVDLSQEIFTCNDEGMNTVIITVEDESGNTGTCTSIVTVLPCEVLPCDSLNIHNSLIPNADFEELTNSGIEPDFHSQLDRAKYWVQATQATSDYLSFTHYPARLDITPPMSAAMPPNGSDHYVGGLRTVGVEPGGQDQIEYIGACLNSPIIANTEYSINMLIGAPSESFQSKDILKGDIVILGIPHCNFPLSGLDCKEDEYEELGRVSINLSQLTWKNFNIRLLASQDYPAIMFGLSCTTDPTDNRFYFLADDLVLQKGNPCKDDVCDPICLTKDITVQIGATGSAVIDPAQVDNNSYDQCGNVTLSLDRTILPCENVGINTLVLTVEDEAGNTSTCQTNVELLGNESCDCLNDINPPILSCNSQVVVYELNQNGEIDLNLDLHQVQYDDNCGIDTVHLNKAHLTCDDLTTVPQSITVMVRDLSGNSTSCNIRYILLDPKQYCIPKGCDIECHTNTINLSTGIDNNNLLLPIGQYVGNWELIDGPDQDINYPRPGFVLNPNTVWDQLPGSQYISPFPNANNNGSFSTPYLFERCFCVCEESAEVELNIAAHVDNFINIGLYEEDGTLIQDLIDYSGSPDPSTFLDPAFVSNTIHNLDRGTYCLRAGMRNDGSVTMGMQINAAVTNAGFIESRCCTPYTYIIGTVFNDVMCDTLHQPNQDEGLEGIEVHLLQNGSTTQVATTDKFGYYVFHDLPLGEYAVIAQGGTNFESTLGQDGYILNLSQDTVISNIDFGYCKMKDECCASSEELTNLAHAQLNSDAIQYDMNGNLEIGAPELYPCQYVSTIYWGDGEVTYLGPNDDIPIHSYNGNGSYLLSIEVTSTLDNGEHCQVDIVNHVVILKDCTVSTEFPHTDKNSIKIYPIPFKEELFIDFSRNEVGFNLEIYNVNGQLVDEAEIPNNINQYTYKNSNMLAGAYLFKLTSTDGVIIMYSKVVKI